MWGRRLLVISVPFVLAWLSFGKRVCDRSIQATQLGFSATSLAMIGALVEPSAALRIPNASTGWYQPVGTAAFSASISVNAIVATLLAIKIYQLQRQAEQALTVQKRKVHPVRAMISIFNDSGMLMLGCQIAWLVLFRRNNVGFYLVRGPIVMIYVRMKSRLSPLNAVY